MTSNDQQCLSIHLSYTLTTPCHTMFIAVTNFLLRQRQQSAVASPRRSTGRDLLGLSAVLRRWNQALIRLRVTRENEFYSQYFYAQRRSTKRFAVIDMHTSGVTQGNLLSIGANQSSMSHLHFHGCFISSENPLNMLPLANIHAIM